MLEQQERLWNYEAVEPGQSGQPTLVTLTAENIGEYALAAQNPDPRYQGDSSNLEFDGRLAAMPTMAITYAPLEFHVGAARTTLELRGRGARPARPAHAGDANRGEHR